MKVQLLWFDVGQTLECDNPGVWFHTRKIWRVVLRLDVAWICTLARLSPLPSLGSPILICMSPDSTSSIIHLHMRPHLRLSFWEPQLRPPFAPSRCLHPSPVTGSVKWPLLQDSRCHGGSGFTISSFYSFRSRDAKIAPHSCCSLGSCWSS